MVIANHKAGLSELNRNLIGTLSELNRNSIGTTSEVVGTMSAVVGTFTKPALELYRRLSELCMYMSEVVGTFANPLLSVVGPVVLSVVATCGLGWSHSGDLAYLRVVLGLVVAVPAVPEARGCCPALPAACASC